MAAKSEGIHTLKRAMWRYVWGGTVAVDEEGNYWIDTSRGAYVSPIMPMGNDFFKIQLRQDGWHVWPASEAQPRHRLSADLSDDRFQPVVHFHIRNGDNTAPEKATA